METLTDKPQEINSKRKNFDEVLENSLINPVMKKRFIKQLIHLYKEEPLLWNTKHAQYNNKDARNKIYERIAEVLSKRVPGVDTDFVRTKIQILRCCFRKEYKKVLQAKDTNSIYVPKLWYYKYLLFLTSEDGDGSNDPLKTEENSSECSDDEVSGSDNSSSLNDKSSLIDESHNPIFIKNLIAVYKQHPNLWDEMHGEYRNHKLRAQSYENIVKSIKKYVSYADADFVRKKINDLRTAFRKVYLKAQTARENNEIYVPRLWYYNLLLFLEDNRANKRYQNQKKVTAKVSSGDVTFSSESDDTRGNTEDDYNIDSDSLVHPGKEQQQLLIEFISLYKELPYLWDMKNKDYSNRELRREGYQKLADLCKKYVPEADEEFVRLKINSFRCCFVKEYKKVMKAKTEGQVYKPYLWYYDLLLFLKNEECDESKIDIQSALSSGCIAIKFWTKEYTVMVIELTKQHKVLYEQPYYHRTKRERWKACNQIAQNLTSLTGKCFKVSDVYKKICSLRSQFLKEFRKIDRAKQEGQDSSMYKPGIWYYDLVKYFEKSIPKAKVSDLEENNEEVEADEESNGDAEEISYENDNNMDIDQDDSNQDAGDDSFKMISNDTGEKDIFDTIGLNVTRKLRSMNAQQRQIAEKILNEVMYYGQMEELTSETHLVIKT